MNAERSLRAFFTVLGLVALVAGAYGAVTGIGGMAGDAAGTASVDSELRFLAVSWAAYGAACLWAAPRVAGHPGLIRALLIVLFAAGLARIVSWADAGRPAEVYIVLMALELLCPPLAWLAQRRVAGPAPRG